MATQLDDPERGNNTTTKQALQRIVESVTDGRAENIRLRKEQLFSLHSSLARGASAICHALALKRKGTRQYEATAEAEVEYYLTLEAVRHFYEALDLVKELKDEYRVANGRNHDSRRMPYGLAVIRPLEHHSRFYSIVVPLAAALSAGNCVVVEMPQSRPGDENYDIDIQLWSILTQALDSNIFCFADDIDKHFSKDDLESPFVLFVDERGRNDSESSISARHHLLSLNSAPALAIVDRTADINEAVQIIARASLSFGGSSPYAPDLILVNEFVKDQVLEAFSKIPDVEVAVHDFRDRSPLLANIERGEQGDNGSISMAPYSSLVDAVSAIKPSTQLLAGYLFAEPRAAKYLSQHLPCATSYINQIPIHLLVGPAAPAVTTTTAYPDLLYRYNRDMFSQPRPQIIEPPPRPFHVIENHLRTPILHSERDDGRESRSLRGILRQACNRMIEKQERRRVRQNLVSLAKRPLKPAIRPTNEDVGFFESGFLLAAGLVVFPVLGWGSYVLGRRMLSS